MSFCNHKSFPEQANERTQHIFSLWHGIGPQTDTGMKKRASHKKASLCARYKGSYTLEAAVVIPVVAVFLMTILFFFRVLQIQTQVQESLNYASRKTACEASAVSSSAGLLVSAEAYFRRELKQYELPGHYIRGGKNAITLLQSDVAGPVIALQANYYVKLPIPFFAVKGLAIQQKSKSHKWIGDREDQAETDYVYVTKHGSVYHRSRACHYLDLSIQTANAAEVDRLRNKDAHKYSACAECGTANGTQRVVYITDYGTCYHTSLACGGLKRTIYLIPIDEAGDKGPCSKCGS